MYEKRIRRTSVSFLLVIAMLILTGTAFASDFKAIMRDINKVYKQEEELNFVKQWLLCFLLVLILALAIISINILLGAQLNAKLKAIRKPNALYQR